MGRNPGWLNEKQIEVLKWVRDGCPTEDNVAGYERRITARALQRRGLVRIKGHGASWAASITDAGSAWLAAHPGPEPIEADVDALISRVVAADGPFVLPEGLDLEVRHEQLVRMSERSAARPVGWRLEMRTTGPWEARRKEIVLVRYFEDLVEEAPVRVPERVSVHHPMIKAYLADKNRQLVDKEHLVRAARILQAIADEAPRRGLTASTSEQALAGADAYRDRLLSRAHLVLRSPAGEYGVRIQEVSASGGKPVPRRRWDARKTRPAWLDARTTEFVSTGLLELVVEGPATGYSGDRYRDAKTISLEEKLPRLFRAIELHRRYAEHRDEERKREAAERQRRWQDAMLEARRRYDEQARLEDFRRRAMDWRSIAEHRAFLAAVRAAASVYYGRQRDELTAHLDFVERRLDESDPLKHVELVLPDVPEPTPDDLKPFLDGWSPRGPGSIGW